MDKKAGLISVCLLVIMVCFMLMTGSLYEIQKEITSIRYIIEEYKGGR